jgi:hypothetical protein
MNQNLKLLPPVLKYLSSISENFSYLKLSIKKSYAENANMSLLKKKNPRIVCSDTKCYEPIP